MTKIRALLMAGVAVFAAPTLVMAQSADTITVGISADANTFDPAAISSRDNSNIAKHIFGTLYEITPAGEIVPDLAESYVEAEDGRSYTYTLREGLVCEDGEALTAEDAAYSFNRAADPANAFTGNTPGFVYSSIQFAGAEAISDREVKINLGQKNPVSFGLIAEVFIHCKDSYEAMRPKDTGFFLVRLILTSFSLTSSAPLKPMEEYTKPGVLPVKALAGSAARLNE